MGIITDQWKNKSYVAADALIPKLYKYASGGGDNWNGGAVSRAFLPTIQAAGMSWVTRELDKHRMCGLSADNDANQSYTDIDLAWYAIGDGTLQVYESGILRYDQQPTRPSYTAGDILEIQLEYLLENLGFNDDFNDNSLDPAKWTPQPAATTTTVEEINNRLEFTVFAGSANYHHIDSPAFSMSNRQLVVDTLEAIGSQYSYHENFIWIRQDDTKQCFLYFGSGQGLARIYDNGTYYQTGFSTGQAGVNTTKFRFRHDATTNTLYLDSLFNGAWVNQLTRVLTNFDMSSVSIRVQAGQYANSGVTGKFIIDNLRVTDNPSGWAAKYYHTDFATAVRTLRYTSQRDIAALFPNMRIDSSIYHEGGTIENVQYLGAGWLDEKGRTLKPTRIGSPAKQEWQLRLNGIFGGSGGAVVPPVTTGQIYPRGIK